jgi:hypothetical protein
MRFILAAILVMVLIPSLPAADWVADGANWKVTTANYGDVVVTAEVKAKLEKCRASDNFRYRWAEGVLDASNWVNLLKVGFSDTQHNNASVRKYILDPGEYKWWIPMWRDFVDRYISDVSSDPEAEALAFVVKSPPSQP